MFLIFLADVVYVSFVLWTTKLTHECILKYIFWRFFYHRKRIICFLFDNSRYAVYLVRWYAKRFLHPDVVAAYEYIFIWDEDLGVEHFNADK